MGGAHTVKGYADYCESVRDAYHSRIAKALSPETSEMEYKVFGHYLDCEAHLDMLIRLNKTANLTNEK